MVGLPGDAAYRTDRTAFPVNRMFADVPQDEPEMHAEPGFEGEVPAFNLFAYLSRSDVTWNPSVCSVVERQPVLPDLRGIRRCPSSMATTGSNGSSSSPTRSSGTIKDKTTGVRSPRSSCKAGDVAAMPADIRHQGYSPKRSMLMVWENASAKIPELISEGKAPNVPVTF